ncbi:hypothetical protein [Streptomyces laurentii]|uniref:hypothetical protein n=1 Tax=Streptomyces laurentii TaxID=39478 RepID=UPI0033F1A0D8
MLTTVGGGVFGVVSASLSDGPGGGAAAQSSASGRSETPAGRDTSDSRPGTGETPGTRETPGTPSTPESGPTAKPASCTVDSEIMTCVLGKAGVKLYKQREYDPNPSRTLAAGDTVRFLCWGPGTSHVGGNKIWYWTNEAGRYGNVPAADLDLSGTPVDGLRECGR